MKITYNIIMIVLSIIFIVDISGVMEYIKRTIFKIINGRKVNYVPYELKPFDCSLCMTFWIIIIYLFILKYTIINVVFIASMCAISTIIISPTIKLIIYSIKKLLDKIYEKWN